MFTEILDQLIVVSEGFALLGTTWFIWFISGVANNMFSTVSWSWKRTGEDILKTALMIFAALAWVVVFNLLKHYATALGADISQFLDGVSVAGLASITLGASSIYAYKGFRNIVKFFVKDHTILQKIEAANLVSADVDFAKAAEPTKELIGQIFDSFSQPEESVDAQEQFEEEGGRGAYFSIDISSYQTFRAAVIGKGFDIDGAWGAQCYDGCALLWQQIGRSLLTGNGCAYGCWTLKRDVNAGNDFNLITNLKDVMPGDVVVTRGGEFGHIAFADEKYSGSGYLRLLGQNQGGVAYPGGGSNFNVVNMNMSTFLGAFRFKRWESTAPSSQPAPSPLKSLNDVAQEVIVGKWGNAPERYEKLRMAGYDAEEVQSIVNGLCAPKDKPSAAPKGNTIEKGSTVVPTRLVDYTGRPLRSYHNSYVVSQLKGNRAVLTADGAVWAAMRVEDLKLA